VPLIPHALPSDQHLSDSGFHGTDSTAARHAPCHRNRRFFSRQWISDAIELNRLLNSPSSPIGSGTFAEDFLALA
jgi:hypothetical protein